MSVYGKLALFGIILHLILFYSIFDIYYSSPLIRGTRLHPITLANGLATRLVIFSADGLRSDLFFEHVNNSPFLHGIIDNGKASWGVSVSHVPTESRPGHVAILAGFYEDVSAVTSGWKNNPVPFDSIINRSHEAWAWGSPDIVSMFTDEVDHANADIYSAKLEDFFSSDASKLDEWVFTRVQEMFSSDSAVNGSLGERLHAGRIVFLLHLLGLDTNGHGHKPHSSNYIDNIGVVDKGIEAIDTLFHEYFHDNRTVFLFTSDHGMTDWGSHGAGTDEEVLTPFVIWGSGVRPSPLKKKINQVDLAPLMAALLGVPVPMNSVGSLPIELLDASPKYLFQSSYANLKQMLEQFMIKRNEKKSHTLSIFFTEFADLRPEALAGFEKEIKRLVEMRRFGAAAQLCLLLLERVRAGILYFHRYERTVLGTAVAAAFSSWIWLVFIFSTRDVAHMSHDGSLFIPQPIACMFLLVALMALLAVGMPPSSCIYILLPLYTASVAYNASGISLKKSPLSVRISLWFYRLRGESFSRHSLSAVKLCSTLVSIALLLFVLTSIFTQRWLLSVITLFMALLPHLESSGVSHLHAWKRLWSTSCVFLAIFPLLPAVGLTPVPFVCFIAPLLFSGVLFWLRGSMEVACAALFTRAAQFHLLTAFIILCMNYSSINEHPQTFLWEYFWRLLQLLCWLSIPLSFIAPLYSPPILMPRLIIWFAFLHIPYSLLSISYESLFLEVFFVLLFAYVRLEYGHLHDEQFLHMPVWGAVSKCARDMRMDRRSLSSWEWSRGVLLVVFIEIAFFGTGNVASLNSFNPSFLRRFMSVFSPFTMGALLLLKVMLPFLGVAFAFVTIMQHRSLHIATMAQIILIITDAMAVVFFMQLVDEGSWLQIGMSISHYVISMAMSVIVFFLLHLAHILLPLSVGNILRNKCSNVV
uniref:GPI ethanolamine phosphate transferase 1 n=1 Tax=Ascaris suum TaxID=6253 RepID=F1KUM5_ASCSU